jgi:hypothetical protein
MRGQGLLACLLGTAAILAASDLLARPAAPAGAAPQLPDGWRQVPELALAAEPGPVRIESRRAYADPATGCYALVQQASADRARPEAARRALVSGLKKRGLEVSGEGDELEVRGLGLEGRIRTAFRARDGERSAAVSTACFYNQRQPERCKAQCDALLDRLGGG